MFAGLDVAQDHTARRWTAMVSFTLQAAFVAAAFAVPLLRPERLPEAFAHRRIFVPTPQGDVQTSTLSNPATPSRGPVIPLLVNRGPSVNPAVGWRNGLSGIEIPPNISLEGTDAGAVPFSTSFEYVRPVLSPVPTTRPPRQSVMMEGNLLHRITPAYPVIAKQLRIEGTVVIRAVISRAGTIEQPEVLSGNHWLAAAALDAVRGWKYRPYQLNGAPVEVETQITVNFVLR